MAIGPAAGIKNSAFLLPHEPHTATPPTKTQPDPSPLGCDESSNRGSLILVSDLQYCTEPDNMGMLGGSFGDVFGPTFRPAGQTATIAAWHEEGLLQARDSFTAEEWTCNRGVLDAGDIPDLGSTVEWDAADQTHQRVEKTGDGFRRWLIATSNHGDLWRGNFDGGSDFGGGATLGFRLQGQLSFDNDVALPELGFAGRRLNKEVEVRRQIISVHGYSKVHYQVQIDKGPIRIVPRGELNGIFEAAKKLNEARRQRARAEGKKHKEIVVRVEERLNRNMYTVLESFNRGDYLGRDAQGNRIVGAWHNKEQVRDRFWREENGVWESIVRIPGGEKSAAQWIHLSAYQADEVTLADGRRVPIIVVAVDTRDEATGASIEGGGVKGYVSYVSGFLLDALYSGLPEYAYVVPFMHHPPEDILEIRRSGLGKIFSDPRTKFILHGHQHRSSMLDLMAIPYEPGRIPTSVHDSPDLQPQTFAEVNGIRRENPLVSIGLSSGMDYMPQLATLRWHLDPQDGNAIVMDFRYLPVDESKIPGTGEEVRGEMERLAPQVFEHLAALARITDDEVREAADRDTTWYKRIYNIGHIPSGLLLRLGHDGIDRHDTLHAVFSKGEVYTEIYITEMELALRQAGMVSEAETLGKNLRRYLAYLQDYYKQISGTNYKANGPYLDEEALHAGVDENLQIELAINPNGAAIPLVSELAEALRNPEIDPLKQHLLQQVVHMLPHLYAFMTRDFKGWLDEYERLRRTNRPNHEWVSHMNLLGEGHAKILESDHLNFRRETWARALAVHLHLETARLDHELREGRLTNFTGHRSPDRIMITAKPHSLGSTHIAVRSEMPSAEEIASRTTSPWSSSLIHTPGGVRSLVPAPPKVGEPRPPWESPTWTLGFSGGPGVSFEDQGGPELVRARGFNGGPYVGYGHVWSLMDHAYSAMVQVYGGGLLHFVGQVREVEVARHRGNGTIAPEGLRRDLYSLNLDLPAEVGVTVGDPLGIIAARGRLLAGGSLKNVQDWEQSHTTGLIGVGAGLALLRGAAAIVYDYRVYPDDSRFLHFDFDDYSQGHYLGLELQLVMDNLILRSFFK